MDVTLLLGNRGYNFSSHIFRKERISQAEQIENSKTTTSNAKLPTNTKISQWRKLYIL